MSKSKSTDEIPKELKEKLARFDTYLSDVEETLNPLLSMNRQEFVEKIKPIDAAKTDLVTAYAINSLFWMYMNVCGQNPKEHTVKQELTRVQSFMGRVKEIEDKAKAPKLDKGATKRFVRSALWQAAQKKGQDGDGSEESTSAPQKQTDAKHKKAGNKRKRSEPR